MRGLTVVAALLLLALFAPQGCRRDESPAQAPGVFPEAPSPQPAPGARPEPDRPRPPIPPLQGAERPTESPLNELSKQAIDPAPELPDLAPPTLEDAGERETPEPPVEAPEGEAAAALDLDALSARLRETRALGIFTKVALKNQIDDLTDELRRFHRKGRGQIDALRDRYDGLVLKIMSLVQDEEPALARDIARSREQLWAMLADARTFFELTGGTS